MIAAMWTVDATAGDIKGKLEISGRKQADATVVYVEAVKGKVKVPKKTVRLSQRGQRFRPTVVPVVVGQRVDMTNDDFVVHNIFSNSEIKKFNLEEQEAWQMPGAAKAPASGKADSLPDPVVPFTDKGEVDIHCNIHPKMKGAVLVLQNPYFAKPDKKGAFVIKGVPAGKYTVRVYQFKGEAKSADVQVPKKGAVVAKF